VVAVPPSLPALAAAAVLAASLLTARADREAMPHVAPSEVGMSAERLAVIDRVVGHAIEAGGFPGAAVIVGRHGAIVWERGYGTLDGRSSGAVDPERTLYDLASLTKVVATSAAAMVLVDQGRLRLDDPVARYVPAFSGGAKSRVTVRHLLTHRSGLPAGRELSRTSAAESRQLVLRTSLEAEPGTRYEYSDLGPIILGFVVERVTGEPLDRFVQRAVYARLGMRSTTFRPSRAIAARIGDALDHLSTVARDARRRSAASRAARYTTAARTRSATSPATPACSRRRAISRCSRSSCWSAAATAARVSCRTARSRRSSAAARQTARRWAGRRAPAAAAAAACSPGRRSGTRASPGHRCGSIPSATCS
jgi:CubicO group peptidase (beta-lactamase class C family)